MTPLRAAMIRAMQVRGFSPRTHESYLAAVTDLARYFRCSPTELDVKVLRRYFEYLAVERALSPVTCRLLRLPGARTRPITPPTARRRTVVAIRHYLLNPIQSPL